MELEILRKIEDKLRYKTTAEANVAIRPVRTSSKDDDEIRILISPGTTDLQVETSHHYEYLFNVNVDIDVPDDDPEIISTTMEVHQQVVSQLIPQSLANVPFGLTYVSRMTPTGSEELAATDDSELPNLIRRTTWEFVYRSTLDDFT